MDPILITVITYLYHEGDTNVRVARGYMSMDDMLAYLHGMEMDGVEWQMVTFSHIELYSDFGDAKSEKEWEFVWWKHEGRGRWEHKKR